MTERSNQASDSVVSAAAASALSEHDGYAQHFERRPEFRIGRALVADVVDASTIRERLVDDLMLVRIPDIFAGKNETFLGFGVPNAFIVCPDGKPTSGYQKFAVKSMYRAPSAVVDTRGFIQSGLLIRFKNLPPEAVEKLREAMAFYTGQKFVTCVNGCMHALERAGFASGDRPLTDRVWPYKVFEALLRDGITFNGQPVEFDVIRTSPTELGRFGWRIKKAVVLTPVRHAERNLKPLSAKNKFVHALLTPFRLLGFGSKAKPAAMVKKIVAPALPPGERYLDDINVRVSYASFIGSLLRMIWGSHALFEAQQSRVDAGAFLSEPLKPFPQPNPSFVTKVKKTVLFNKLVIKFIRLILAPDWVDIGARNERNVYDMLRTHTEESPQKYNLVITRRRVILARTHVLTKLVDWIMSKHVLMSGYDPEVLFAGEIWKDADGVIHINRNSGTYQPSEAELAAALAFFQSAFPHLRFVIDPI